MRSSFRTRFATPAAAAFVLAVSVQTAWAQGLLIVPETEFRYSGWPSQTGLMNRTLVSQDLFLDYGACEDCKVRVQASFRLEADPAITDREASLYPALHRISPMLQYAYVDYMPAKFVELKAGRIIDYDPDTFMTYDGAAVRFFFVMGVGVEGSFGMAVRESWPMGYQGPLFDGPIADQPPMTLIRAGAFAEGRGGFAGKVLYRRAFDGQIEKEDVSGAFTVETCKYLILGMAAEYSTLLRQLDFVRADAVVPVKDFTVKAAYTRRVPVFTGSSIFNYFGLNPYDEYRLTFGYSSGKLKAVTASYYFRLMQPASKQGYDNGGDASVRGMLAPNVEGGLALGYAEGMESRRGSASVDVTWLPKSWLGVKFGAGGSKFGDSLVKAFDGWSAFGTAGTEFALGYGLSLGLDFNVSWDTLYGVTLYGSGAFKGTFDIKI
jgi:hypothetical protein